MRIVGEEAGLQPEGPFTPLDGAKTHGHKRIFAWAAEHDCDPAVLMGNTFTIEWPPRSGRTAASPEVDCAAWFDLAAACTAIVAAQSAHRLDAVGSPRPASSIGNPLDVGNVRRVYSAAPQEGALSVRPTLRPSEVDRVRSRERRS